MNRSAPVSAAITAPAITAPAITAPAITAPAGPAPAGPDSGAPVLILDDHELFSVSLGIALANRGFDTHQLPVGGPGTLAGLLRDQLERHPRPGLLLLDLDLGPEQSGRRVDGVELIDVPRRAGWQVLVVTGATGPERTAAAVAAGALGVLTKSSRFDDLVDAVVAALAGEPVMTEDERSRWLAWHRGHQAEQRELSRRMDRLSAREREVLELLVEGMRAADIAERFVVSMTTVRTQIRSILAKLEVNSQLAAVALARHTTPR